jgi:hypothetical protein
MGMVDVFNLIGCLRERFEDTKPVTRSRKSKDRQYNDNEKNVTKTNNVLQSRKRKIEYQQPQKNTGV